MQHLLSHRCKQTHNGFILTTLKELTSSHKPWGKNLPYHDHFLRRNATGCTRDFPGLVWVQSRHVDESATPQYGETRLVKEKGRRIRTKKKDSIEIRERNIIIKQQPHSSCFTLTLCGEMKSSHSVFSNQVHISCIGRQEFDDLAKYFKQGQVDNLVTGGLKEERTLVARKKKLNPPFPPSSVISLYETQWRNIITRKCGIPSRIRETLQRKSNNNSVPFKAFIS